MPSKLKTSTKKLNRRQKQTSTQKTKKKNRTKPNSQAGGGPSSPEICTKTNINDLLMGDFKPRGDTSLSGSPKQFANDIKKQATDIGKVAGGNWLASPGAPPPFPKCTIM